MTELFTLLGRAWIPVAHPTTGRRVFIRPREITTAIDGLLPERFASGRADIDIVLTEHLIGLLAVACGPTSMRNWHKRYLEPPAADALDMAFAPFAEAFVLDGPGVRFFQDLEELEGGTTPVEALFIDAPAEHFTKPGRTGVLSRVGAALALMTLQTQAPAGGAGHRTSLRGGGPLTTLVIPPVPEGARLTLWHLLWANTPSDFQVEPDERERAFPWLVKTRTSNPKAGGKDTTPLDVHKAQAFFGLPRRIRLRFEPNTARVPCDLTGLVDEVIVREYVTRPWGTNYVAWSQGHPLSPYYRPKQTDVEMRPVHLQSARVGYRQWLGFAHARSGDETRLPATVVKEFRTGRAQQFDTGRLHARLLACGYAMDNMKPLDFGEATMPLLATGDPERDERLAIVAGALVDAADLAAYQLRASVKLALYGNGADVDSGSATLAPVTARFWLDTEADFYQALGSAADENGKEAAVRQTGIWRQRLHHHALRIFDDTAPLDTTDMDRIESLVLARKSLSLMFEGYGGAGRKLFKALGLPEPKQAKANPKERST